jgi:hypothetical protein
VSLGRGPDATPVLVRVRGGTQEVFSLDKVTFSKA